MRAERAVVSYQREVDAAGNRRGSEDMQKVFASGCLQWKRQ